MGGTWRWAAATCGCGALLVARSLARPLDSLNREHWVPLDSAEGDQTTDVAVGTGGSMVYISGFKLGAQGSDGIQNLAALLMAYNSSGARQWVVEYGSSGNDQGNSVAADSTGVYLAGTASVRSNNTEPDDADDTDAFVVKYNSTGGLLWKTSWGTSDLDAGNGVAVDDGSSLLYVVGTTRGSMGADVLTLGSVAAEEGEQSSEEGGTGSADLEGEIVAANSGASDVFLTCLDATDGEIRWTVQFGSTASDAGNRVAVGPRGGVFVVGQLGDDDDPSLTGARAFLAKYDYLGNAQFTARLNTTSTHYAIDLAPSLGSGGEGVVYMTGYTLGANPTVFLARFEGSTGTQTWLSRLGEGIGPHLAQSVAVVEGSGAGSSSAGGGDTVRSRSDSGAEGGNPEIEDEEAGERGNDARVVVVGYNTSEASALSHSSTGFTAAADTSGKWAWYSVSQKADRETAISVGAAGSDATAFVVGTVAASEASPGNYLFLDIQRVVREELPTPPPSTASNSTPAPTAYVNSLGEASTTTGLSQSSSLWLLIIGPIFVVVSCILMMGYVSKQCSIAFGTGIPGQSHEPVGSMEFSSHGDREQSARVSRSRRGLRRGDSPTSPSEWRDESAPRPGSTGRRKRDGKRESWPRSVAAVFRDKSQGPPYRKLGTKGRSRGGRGGKKYPPSREDGEEASGGEIELGVPQRTPYDSPQASTPGGESWQSGGGGGGGSSGSGGGRSSGGGDRGPVSSYPDGPRRVEGGEVGEDQVWEAAFEGGPAGDVVAAPYTGNPRDDEPVEAPNSGLSTVDPPDSPHLLL